MAATHKGALCWLLVLLHLATARSGELMETSDVEHQQAQEQDQVAILKQINRVNDDGSYTFGYEAADGSFKIETRDVQGNVKGMFGFVDESGSLKRVSYSASNATGFRAVDRTTTAAVPGPGVAALPPVTTQRYLRHDSPTRRPVLRQYGLRTTVATTDTNSDQPIPSPRPGVIQVIPRYRKLFTTTTTTERTTTTSEASTHRTTPQFLFKHFVDQQTLQSGDADVTPTAEDASEGLNLQLVRQYVQPQYETTTLPSRRIVYVTRRPVVEEDDEDSAEEVSQQIRPSTTRPVFYHNKVLPETTTSSSKSYARKAPRGNGLRRQLVEEPPLVYYPVTRVIRLRQPDHTDVYDGSAASGATRVIPDTPFRDLFTPLRAGLIPRFPEETNERDYPPPGPVRIPLSGRPEEPVPEYVPQDPRTLPYPPNERSILRQIIMLQLLLAHQRGRYRPQPNGSSLSPAAQLPPDLIQDILQLYGGIQPAPYNPQYEDPPYGGRYPPPSDPYPSYPPRQYPYPQPPPSVPVPRQPIPPPSGPQSPDSQPPVTQPPIPTNPSNYETTYSQAAPYDPRRPIHFPPQYPVPAQPQPDVPTQPSSYPPTQLAYDIQRRLRFRPRIGGYGPQQVPLPVPPYDRQYPVAQPSYDVDGRVPYYPQPLPYDIPQIQYRSPPLTNRAKPRVGNPHDLMPDQYREALFLRMLAAIRSQQQLPETSEFQSLESSTSASTSSTTAITPTSRKPMPVRNVQILDPVTDEPTAKRSTNTTATPSETKS